MLSHQPFTSLFAGPSSQGAFFSAIMFLWHTMATVTTWHPSHSKWHEAAFVLVNERSSRCWTCSISDWATHPGSQHWSARDASSSIPISLSSTLFALVTGPTLPLPRQQLSCTLPKTQSSCMAETSLGLPDPYLFGKGPCSCPWWAVAFSAFPQPLVFVLRLTRWKSVINCGIFYWRWSYTNPGTGYWHVARRNLKWEEETAPVHYRADYLKSFLYYMNFCFPEVVLPLGLVMLEVQARGSPSIWLSTFVVLAPSLSGMSLAHRWCLTP